MMASEEAKGSFCRDDSCVVTNQLATDPGALERELLLFSLRDGIALYVGSYTFLD
jgi:hypothetical protein